jgi:hypothetical protein
MLDQIGWWTFDAQTQTLLNRASGQRVRFEGAVDDAGTCAGRRAVRHDCAFGTRTLKFAIRCS